MWPTVYVNFSALAATSTVAILQVPDGKSILVTVNYGRIHSACMEYNKWIATMAPYMKVISTIQSNSHCSFSLSHELNTIVGLCTVNSQPLEQLQLSILQASDSKDSGIFV